MDLLEYRDDGVVITEEVFGLGSLPADCAGVHVDFGRNIGFGGQLHLLKHRSSLSIVLHDELLFQNALLFGLDAIQVFEYLFGLAVISYVHDVINLLLLELLLTIL